MTPLALKALDYIENAGGRATVAHFFEDHEPIGPRLWDEVRGNIDGGPPLVGLNELCGLVLTEAGRTVREQAKAAKES